MNITARMSFGRGQASPLLLLGAVAAILAPILMWAEFLGVGLSTPGYNVFTRAASDLGAVGAPAASLFMPGFFIVPGVLTVLVGAALLAIPSGSSWWRVGCAIVAINGLLLVLAGLNSESATSSSATARHQMLAALCFSAAALAPLPLLAGLPRATSNRSAPRAWLVSAPLLLILQIAGLVAGYFVRYPDGLFQRPFGITLTIWYAGTALLLLRRSGVIAQRWAPAGGVRRTRGLEPPALHRPGGSTPGLAVARSETDPVVGETISPAGGEMMLPETRPPARLGYVDVIKGLVVAGVVAAHAAMTYGLFGNWPYQETVHPFPATIGYAAAVVTMLGMGMLFLIAGLFTPAAMASKGLRRFVNDRWVRLGLPAAIYLVAVMPTVNFFGHLASGSSAAMAGGYARDHVLRFDLGPMWFVFALLLVTLGYAGWRRFSRPRAPGVRTRDLVLLAAVCAAVTFSVRVVQPVDDPAPVNVAGWPPDFILFVLGGLAGAAWLERVPATALRAAAAMIAAGLVLLLPLAVLSPPSFSFLLGGWHWESAVVSAAESLVTIGSAIWILRQFQRIPRDPVPTFTHGSFAAYLVQTPVILLLGIAMRPLVLAPELKAVILAAFGIAACFSLAAAYRGWTRTRRRGGAKPSAFDDAHSRAAVS